MIENSDNVKKDLEELLKQLQDLKDLRASLESSSNTKENDKKIEEVKTKTDELVKSTEVIEELKKQLAALDEEIESVQQEIVKGVKSYEESYKKLQEVIDRETEELDKSELLSEEAINVLKADYAKEKIDINNQSVEVLKNYERQKKLLAGLRTKRNRLRKDIEKCEALDLSMSEYKEISSTLRKTKIVEAILKEKGLYDIISKPSKERTKEEKDKLKEAKEEIMKEISEVKKANETYSSLDAIQALYSIDVSYEKGKTRVTKIPKNELAIIKENVKNLPVLFVDYKNIPKKTLSNEKPKDMEGIDDKLAKEESAKTIVDEEPNERIIIFKDKSTGDLYVRKYVKDRFKDWFKFNEYDPKEESAKINGSLCFKIGQEQADFIINNASNDFSPYLTRIDEVDVEKEEKDIIEEEPISNLLDEENQASVTNGDDDTKKVIKKYTADDYNMVQEGFDEMVADGYVPGTEEFNEALRSSGYIGTPIDLSKGDDDKMRVDNTSPINPFTIGPDDTIDELIPGTNIKKPRWRKTHESDDEYEEFLKNYYDTVYKKDDKDDDKGKDLIPVPNGDDTDDEPSGNGDDQEQDQDEDKTPVPTPEPSEEDNPEDEESKGNEEEEEELSARHIISEKLTKDLHILKHDGKRYVASKVVVTQEFMNELHAGNYIYNISHLASALVHIPTRFIKKVWSKIALGPDGIKTMEELEDRLNNLTEPQLQILYDQYKGTTALSDMNQQILPMIQRRLRAWVIDKVKKINSEITEHYVSLSSAKHQLEAINKKLENENLDPQLREEYLEKRKELIKLAAGDIREIERLNLEGQKWLSDGLHGLEEDFKAVMSKMNYVGLGFAKLHDFDNELAEKIGNYDHNLKKAIKEDKDEEIYENFMNREQCYIDNTEIKNSIFGKRSVGKKYYSPYAQLLDYKDDPLIRDLITTIALTTAAISVVNAIRVHKIEQAELLKQQQQDANAINAANDKLLAGVGVEAQKIVDGRNAIREGLQAQAHSDVLNTANGLERWALDHYNWVTKGNGYHALDDANHVFYNDMYSQVSGNIGSITAGLRNGSLSTSQALESMNAVASGAQTTFVDVAKTCLTELKTYIPAHPQYDLTATESALEYIVSHPDAITTMNETAINATNIAEGLIGLSPAHVQALSALPSDWLTTLMGAAGSVALANNVVRSMKEYDMNTHVKKTRKASDEIKNMLFGEYEEKDDDIIEEEEEKVSSR